MPAPSETEKLEEPEFQWGKKGGKGGKKRDVQFYESFTYDGVNYCLHDCVYMHKEGEPAPYIGKLVKIWENADKTKKVKVQWFFRPSEISYYLKDTEVSAKELFFASGTGLGLANINPLETIAGKCNVLCISKDSRNPQPSAEELEIADYVFYRIFDVESCSMSDQFGDTVGGGPKGLKVKFVFNRKENEKALDIPKSDSNSKDSERKAVLRKETPVDKDSSQPLKILNFPQNCNDVLGKVEKKLKLENGSQGSVLREIKNVPSSEGLTPGGKCSTGVHYSRDKEVMGVEKSTLGGKDTVCKVNGEKDNVEVKKSHVMQVQAEEKMKYARKSCHLDGRLPKRAKTDDKVSSLGTKDTEDLENLTTSRKDEVQVATGALLSDIKLKSGLIENSVRSGKDVNLAENSDVMEESVSRTTNIQTTKCGKLDFIAGVDKDAKPVENSNDMKEGLPQALRENPESTCVKEGEGMHKKLDVNVGARADSLLKNNGASSKELPRLSETYFSPDAKSKSKSGFYKDLEGQASRVFKSLSTSLKRPMKPTTDISKEKQNLGVDISHDYKGSAIVKSACSLENKISKKGKIDDSIKISGGDTKFANDLKKKVVACEGRKSPNNVSSSVDKPKSILDKCPSRKLGEGGKLSNDSILDVSIATPGHNGGKVEGQIFEVTRRPDREKTKWMKTLPWEERMRTAFDQRKLVLLQNFDPKYTSGEIEDIIWHAFDLKCTARVMPHTAISNPYFGQAFAIFSTTEAAERVVRELDDRCLMLPNQRPLIGCIGNSPYLFEKQMTFTGHLSIDKNRRQIQREMKEAVSTSHYSQNNTIEFEMAMAWCLLQSKSDKWWENLYELQKGDLKKLKDGLKSK